MKCSVFTRRCATALLLSLTSIAAIAAEPVLAEAGKVAIATTDVQGDALRIPAESRKDALSKPEVVLQLANNLVIRRAFAAQAETAGLAKDPAVQGAIKIARDRILSDALFARMDAANKPKAEIVDGLALAMYKSNLKRFELPEETGARHILIKSETPDARAKAAQILADLKAGADFAAVAMEKSEDPGSKAGGGDLGYFARGRMVAPFEAGLAKLQKPGELSDLVESSFGFHIIKLEGRRPAGVAPYDQVKEGLRREVEVKFLNDARLAEVQKIQDIVKMNQPAIDAFAAANK